VNASIAFYPTLFIRFTQITAALKTVIPNPWPPFRINLGAFNICWFPGPLTLFSPNKLEFVLGWGLGSADTFIKLPRKFYLEHRELETVKKAGREEASMQTLPLGY
jgi:hypothetical protein